MKIFNLILFLLSTFIYAQVGIYTTNPQGIFKVNGGKYNTTTGVTTASTSNMTIYNNTCVFFKRNSYKKTYILNIIIFFS
jgi:hypothetical protein